ncbi:hypothetical protein BDC45DRAFT_520401 [Circinella umbellata]|nr:hypothetical protein BDC45DRAFT_520401 [Circinella umbellata]
MLYIILSHIHFLLIYNVDRIRKSLGNAYYPYLEMQRRITSELATELADPTLIKEDGCPACPKDKMFVALDGNMQLRRRKANEKDTVKAEPSLFFEPEKLLNKYDNDSFKPNDNDTTECLSDFKAASQAITSKKLDKFHETGLFGSVCGRHDVLLYFLFMYPLSVLDVILQKHGSNITIFYDIACRFSNAIKKAFEDRYNLDNVNMAVSLFHSFSHSITCQSSYHPRFIEGCNIGLSDGEGCERAWSYFGNFVKITRQMCADRRMAILVHAMLHYQKKRILGLEKSVRLSYKKEFRIRVYTRA